MNPNGFKHTQFNEYYRQWAKRSNALYFYGGATQAIVPDNLKSAVTKSNKFEPTLNESFRDFVEHYRITAFPADPYKPRHKALVEGAVKLIYQAIYTEIRKREFTSLEELNYYAFKYTIFVIVIMADVQVGQTLVF